MDGINKMSKNKKVFRRIQARNVVSIKLANVNYGIP